VRKSKAPNRLCDQADDATLTVPQIRPKVRAGRRSLRRCRRSQPRRSGVPVLLVIGGFRVRVPVPAPPHIATRARNPFYSNEKPDTETILRSCIGVRFPRMNALLQSEGVVVWTYPLTLTPTGCIWALTCGDALGPSLGRLLRRPSTGHVRTGFRSLAPNAPPRILGPITALDG
jgi:hypothetical protein